jgi:tetratricopeptide (TPR) repeat protein
MLLSSHPQMRKILGPGLVVLLCAGVAAQPQPPVDLIGLISAYAEGRRDEAIAKAAALPDLGPLRLRFVQDTPAWVAADPAQAETRRAAVSAFLLELTAARLESDWGRLSDLIEWQCVQLRTANPVPTEFERAWHAASHALAGRARARQWLLGEFAVLPHQKPSKAPPSDPKNPPARHLMHALERFPEDPHFQLNRIVAWTWGRDSEPIRNLRREADDALADARASATRRRLPSQLEAVIALEPLTKFPEVAADAYVRIGVMQFVVRDYAAALRAYEQAQAIATDPATKFVAFLNAGRTLEALQKPDDAARAYAGALAIVPEAESATVALASLRFAGDERDLAVTMIDSVFNRRPSAADPGRLIPYGSFVHWSARKSTMRAAISSTPPVPKRDSK